MTHKGTFCFVCGKVTGELIEGQCRGCYYREVELLRLPEKPRAKVCRECLSYLKHGRQRPPNKDLHEVVEFAAKDVLMGSMVLKDVKGVEVNLSLGNVKRPNTKKLFIPYTMRVTGVHHDNEYSGKKSGKVEIALIICDSCAKRQSRYYEAVLQIRGVEQDEEKIKSLTIDYLERLRGRDPRAFISDFKIVKNGFDIYLGSLGAGRKASHHLAEKYGGMVKESPKLVGKSRDGRDLYRMNISMRLPRFRVDDIISHGSKILQLRGFKSGKVTAYDLESRQRSVLPLKSLNKAEILGRKGEIKRAAVSEIAPDYVQVIEENDTTAYFNVALPLKVGDKVKIFHDGKDYLLLTEDELR
ncbi:MAG: 60S ribosomal export protein NMD3 [Candidatus Hydrothermarchaeota archaeon]|jgi:nonsense-mediated mRNA decay protein 3|nr:60S ribosomal export protein NMD3 [Candidatus Hydrothermarchaeota archaeon]